VNAWRNPDVNLAVECPGHSEPQLILYHYTMVYLCLRPTNAEPSRLRENSA
jgi:hypothetical protein